MPRAVGRSGGVNLSAELDPRDLNRLMRQIRGFDANLSRNLRKRWRDALKPMVEEMKRDLGAGPKAHAIGGAVTVTTTDQGKGRDGVTVAVNYSRLSVSERVLAREWDSSQPFVHPIFGRRLANVPAQQKRPWFQHNVRKHRPRIEAATQQALTETVAQIERGGI